MNIVENFKEFAADEGTIQAVEKLEKFRDCLEELWEVSGVEESRACITLLNSVSLAEFILLENMVTDMSSQLLGARDG